MKSPEEMKFEFILEIWLPSRQVESIQQLGGMGWRAAHCELWSVAEAPGSQDGAPGSVAGARGSLDGALGSLGEALGSTDGLIWRTNTQCQMKNGLEDRQV